MASGSDLEAAINQLTVSRRPGNFAFVTVNHTIGLGAGVEALVSEDEGTTAVVTTELAEQRGWPVDFEAAWLTLDVNSALDLVGLTAVVSTALAERDIACNVMAGLRHDHLLVPVDRAADAIAAITALRDRPDPPKHDLNGATRDHRDHDRHHAHDHAHGHHNDQGLSGIVRYLRNAPRMWRSTVNDATVVLLAPRLGETVVDIGAGMGAGSAVLAKTGATVIAVEPTPFLRKVLTARQHTLRSRHKLSVVDGSAEKLPVDDGSVDAVMAVNTMHHWVNADEGVAEIARALRPGGRTVLVDENFGDPSHPDHKRFSARHTGKDHGFTMVDADDMAERLRGAGLVDIDTSRDKLAGRPVVCITANRLQLPTVQDDAQ